MEIPGGYETWNYRIDDLRRRLEAIEKLEPAVMSREVTNLADEVRSLRKAFYTFAFSVVGSAIVFAFAVFSLIK